MRQTRKLKKKEVNFKGIILYVFAAIPYIIVMMYLYGMAEHYYPDPVEFLPGQYIHVGIGINLFGTIMFIIISSIFTYYIVKKSRK